MCGNSLATCWRALKKRPVNEMSVGRQENQGTESGEEQRMWDTAGWAGVPPYVQLAKPLTAMLGQACTENTENPAALLRCTENME